MRLLAALLLAAAAASATPREDAFRQRVRHMIENAASQVKGDEDRGNFAHIASKLWLKQDLDWCSRRTEALLNGPQSGDMFWMFPVTAVAYLGRDKLTPSARAALRRSWRTYMPYRGDTENHWLLYYSSLYLMAQLYPNEPGETWFTGRSSEENFREAESYLLSWMDLTTTRGQGEYDCTHYIGVYFLPLSYLAAWAEDPAMRLRARMMLEYIMADFAVESLDGLFVGAHARTDDGQVLEKWNGVSSDFGWLLFGLGRPTPGYGGYALMYALASAYMPPEVIHQIATDREQPYLHRELKRTRHRWRFSDVRNAPVYKTTYMRREYAVGSDQGGLLQPVQQHSWDVTWALDDPRGKRNTMFSIHPYSSPHELQMYFTPMPDFITEWVYRSKRSYDSEDKFLGGSPYEQIVQDRDTVIALYNIAPGTRWPHINGFFSKDLARVEEHPSRWIFAQGGQTYLAWYPLAPYEWRPIEDGSRRLFSPHLKNGTILQAAAASEFADFAAFKKAILALPLQVSLDPVPAVRFRTLRGRQLDFTYGKPPIDYASWKTFEGPYLNCDRGSRKLVLTHGALKRTLDFDSLKVTDAGLPVRGIAHVAVRVSDLARARDFYSRVMGFTEAFQFTDNGRTTVAFMKVNDRQYIELYPGRTEGGPPLDHVCLDSSHLAEAHRRLAAQKPGAIEKGRAGNLLFSIKDPGGFIVEFLQFLPGSMHLNATGKALGPGRISQRLSGVAAPLEGGALGLEQWIEPGAAPCIRFEVPDSAAAWRTLKERGVRGDLVDPDGVRLELVEQGEQAKDPYEERWHSVAARLIQSPPESYPYDWGEGVQMIGLMKIWERSHNRAYADYVDRWMALQLRRDIKDLLAIGKPVKAPGFCGHWSPATASLYLYQATRKPEHLRLAQQTAEFISTGADRGPEGALAHWKGNTQLWVDTLYMACPLLSGLGKAEDSARQILAFERRLCDEKAGLFYHMWDWKTGTRTPELWGRGNGWVLMSIADTLEALDRRNPAYSRLKRLASRMTEGLRRTQDADGMWHTVLDDPKSYPEASATAMFCYGLLKLNRLGVLPDEVRPMARKAWQAVNEKYVKDGLVVGVSAGTVTSQSGDFYRKVPVGTETWGTGAYLMAGSEATRKTR